ncbi:MAG: hypothetical protein ACK2UU_13850 [Anaerolineae bacterium]|jgi:hypothetical protein
MNGVTVVTGSSTSLPSGLAKDLGIHVVPIVLALNGHSLLDGVDITPGPACWAWHFTPIRPSRSSNTLEEERPWTSHH